jgi:RNA methyltransferase, TrmH family
MSENLHRLRPEALVRHLRSLRTPDMRQQTGTCYIEGARVIIQAIHAQVPLVVGVVAPELAVHPHAREAVRTLRAGGIPVVELSASDFARISFKEQRHGVGAVMKTQITPISQLETAPANWVALGGLGNSGNLGAILRTCDAVGAAGLLLLDQTTDPYHPAALRASMGAIFAQQLVRASFVEMFAWAKLAGCPVVGTAPDAPQSYRAFSYPQPCILLVGSERTGLAHEQAAACDALVQIPMVGTSDSLNVAVATSVVLYEAFHQREAS